eukprot:maker-scaffold_2-snap-gene-20.32-mRNA-1 protein AED:0.00 eAED:0.00 QI:98/1/1/1/1/1/2/115/231
MIHYFKNRSLNIRPFYSIQYFQLSLQFRQFSSTNFKQTEKQQRVERRREIQQEMRDRVAKGPFYKHNQDIKSLKEGDKPFKTEIIETKPRPFSGILLEKLDKEFLSIHTNTVLCFGFNALSFDMLKLWIPAIIAADAKFIQVSVVENWLFNKFSFMIRSSLQNQISEKLHDKTCLYFGSFADYKHELGIETTLLPYVYLIDAEGSIRFRGCGKPDETDLTLLKAAVKTYQE